MKNNKTTRRSVSVFHQLVQLVPAGSIEKIASGKKNKAREFSYTSQVLSLMLGHFAHAFSLNEICDIMALHAKELSRTRGVTPPKRNTFSYANRTRDPDVAEQLYWEVFEHLKASCQTFAHGRNTGKLAKFRDRKIFAIDSSTLQLSLKCIDWARHRRKKAAAKLHMRTDVACMLPRFAIVEKASQYDSTKAEALCEGLKDGDILIADRGYYDFGFFHGLTLRGVFFVIRDKRGFQFKRLSCVEKKALPKGIISDEKIRLSGKISSKRYPVVLRRIVALVEVDGKIRPMSFITNNMTWSAATVAELYKARWSIELLFKELKQTLQLQDFYGENEQAVKWQIWTALLVHLLLRFTQHVSKWNASFSRLVGVIRSSVWMKVDLYCALKLYGTAPPHNKPAQYLGVPYLPGFLRLYRNSIGQHMC